MFGTDAEGICTKAHFMVPTEALTCGVLHGRKEVWGNLEIHSMSSCMYSKCQNLCDTIILSKPNYIELISFPLL